MKRKVEAASKKIKKHTAAERKTGDNKISTAKRRYVSYNRFNRIKIRIGEIRIKSINERRDTRYVSRI